MKSRTSSSSRALVRSLVSGAAALGLLASARSAEAKPKLAADIDAVIPLDLDNVSVGAGGALRFGYELRLPLISITPEIGLGMYKFGDDLGPRVIRGVAGGRIGFGEVFRPGVYAHVGFGNQYSSSSGFSYSHTGAAFDAGAFMDFTLLPIFDIGIHGGYNVITPESRDIGSSITVSGTAVKWINAGVHASITF